MLLLLLLLCLVLGANATPCPAFFFVIPSDAYNLMTPTLRSEADYGTWILRNGTQQQGPYYILSVTMEEVVAYSHCAITAVVITDAATVLETDIRNWIIAKCKSLQKEPQNCYRPYLQHTRATGILPYGILDTYVPTWSPTMRAQASEVCTERLDMATCKLPGAECHWFGVAGLGCHPVTYCDGLASKAACETRKNYCIWQKGRGCSTRSRKLVYGATTASGRT